MTSHISYKYNADLNLDDVLDLYRATTLRSRRPIHDRERMGLMFKHANLVVTAWDGDILVGVSRAWSDFAFITYLADLAVRESHQRRGIGRELIRKTQEIAGPNATLKLTAAPEAEGYYPRIGFVQVPQCWILPAQDKLSVYVDVDGKPARSEWKI